MVILNSLTNEELKKKFSNNFDLANFAISVAKEHLKYGELPDVNSILKEVGELADKMKLEADRLLKSNG